MQKQLDDLKANTLSALEKISSSEELLDLKNDVLGKKGQLTEILKGVKDLTPEERGTIGKASNDLKKELEAAFETADKRIQEAQIEKQLEQEFEDMTAPAKISRKGHRHPIHEINNDIIDLSIRMGFSVHPTPHVTTEYENFDALNIPGHHPARDMQDTFWLKDGSVLATHTSCLQNHLIKNNDVPVRYLYLGACYRNEKIDATHEIMFDQVEWICIDKDISLANMKHTIVNIFRELFKRDVNIRMRPGYFPFVEPGVEVDVSCPFCPEDGSRCRVCKGSGWIELAGAGLVHPHVIREGGLDPEEYTGFAFAFGTTRLAMIKYGIDDVRHLHQNEIEFLEQF